MKNVTDPKQLNKLICEQFLNDLLDTIKKDCRGYFIDLMREAIQRTVYDAYEPTQYERRGEDGGLLDSRNYHMNVFLDGRGHINVYMKNMATGDSGNFYIDEGIVSGKDFYDWENSKAYYYQQNGGFPRDFYATMEDNVVGDSKLKQKIKRGMEKRNWKSP